MQKSGLQLVKLTKSPYQFFFRFFFPQTNNNLVTVESYCIPKVPLDAQTFYDNKNETLQQKEED